VITWPATQNPHQRVLLPGLPTAAISSDYPESKRQHNPKWRT